jgi:hypothetical protein
MHGLASMYPTFGWSAAPGHHGYQRACAARDGCSPSRAPVALLLPVRGRDALEDLGEQPRLEHGIGHLVGQRPAQSGSSEASDCRPDRRSGDPDSTGDLTARPAVAKSSLMSSRARTCKPPMAASARIVSLLVRRRSPECERAEMSGSRCTSNSGSRGSAITAVTRPEPSHHRGSGPQPSSHADRRDILQLQRFAWSSDHL